MVNTPSYLEDVGDFARKLTRLLKRDFLSPRDSDSVVDGPHSHEYHPVGNRLSAIIKAHGEYEQAIGSSLLEKKRFQLNEAYFKIKLLVRDLERIEEHSISMLDEFAEMLSKSNEDNYYGDRLEVQVASLLIDRGIPFTKREAPDFEIDWNGKQISLECTSVHYYSTRPSKESLPTKIVQAVNGKARKPYARLDMAIVVDITNIHSHSKDDDNLLGDPLRLKKYLQEKIRAHKCGSVILCTYQHETQSHVFSWWCAKRCDSPNASPELMNFLDTAFVRNEEGDTLRGATVPSSV